MPLIEASKKPPARPQKILPTDRAAPPLSSRNFLHGLPAHARILAAIAHREWSVGRGGRASLRDV